MPIKESTKAQVDKVFISNESNCIPGSYQEGKNKFIYSLFDNNENTSFKAFKEGDGPLKISFVVKLKKEEVINKIIIEKQLSDYCEEIDVKDIKLSNNNNEFISIRKLLNTSEQYLKINSKNDHKLSLYFLPAKAIAVAFDLEVKDSAIINDKNIFEVALKKIELYSNRYLSSGEITSEKFNVNESFYEISFNDSIFPKETSINKINKRLSTNNGKDFVEVNQSIFTSGEEKEVVYYYKVEKVLAALNKEDLSLREDFFLEVEGKSLVVNKDYSPNTFSLDSNNFKSGAIKVIERDLLKRNFDVRESTILEVVNGTGRHNISLPVNIRYIKASEFELYCNNVLWSQVDSEEEVVGEGVYYIKNNESLVVNTTRPNTLFKFSCLIKPLIPQVIKKPEGYYVEIKEDFDYDKKQIKVSSVIQKSELQTKLIAAGVDQYIFENEFVDINSFSLEEYVNGSWIAAENQDYELYSKDGVVKFKESLIANEKKVTYSYYNTNVLEDDEYEIWSKNNEVKGLFIHPDKVSFEEISDDLSETNIEQYYLFDGSYSSERLDIANDRSYILSSPNIVRGSLRVSNEIFDGEEFSEIEYQDGVSEHLNITFMDKDYAPVIEKNDLNEVVFSLQEEPYLGAFSQEIEVYKNDVKIPSARFSVNGRIVTLTLTLNERVSSDYYVKYSYIGESKSQNTYSVDYENGILYTSRDVTEPENVKVFYNVGQIGLEYSLCKEVKDFEVDEGFNQIKVFTSKLTPKNNKIKLLYLKSKEGISFKDIKEYYSPIIYKIAIGFK